MDPISIITTTIVRIRRDKDANPVLLCLDDPAALVDYDFIRPVHYEKIEFAKGSSSVNAKILKRQMIEEFTRQKHEQQRTLSSLDVSTSSQQSSSISSQPPSIIEFSIVLENLADHGHLSLQTDVASAFYCMLINCNENKLFMRNNAKRDDLIIQEQPFSDQRNPSALSYSYVSHSNLSVVNWRGRATTRADGILFYCTERNV